MTDAAQASVICDNQAVPINIAGTSDSSGFIRAEDFTLAAGANIITDVHWTGLYAGNNVLTTDNFTIQLFLDTGSGAPQQVPFLSLPIGHAVRTDTGIGFIAGPDHFDLFRYSIDVAPIVLLPATPYWMSVFNDTSADDPAPTTWAWGGRLTGNPSDNTALRNLSPVWGGNSGIRLDLQLTDDAAASAVPEPATLGLVSIALFALGGNRRCKGELPRNQ